MRITKTKTIEQKYTYDILCNKCGKSCHIEIGGTLVKWVEDKGLIEISKEESLELRRPNIYGLIEVTARGGFDSTHLSDMVNYTFSLCEQCLSELFDTFKIPVEEKS